MWIVLHITAIFADIIIKGDLVILLILIGSMFAGTILGSEPKPKNRENRQDEPRTITSNSGHADLID